MEIIVIEVNQTPGGAEVTMQRAAGDAFGRPGTPVEDRFAKAMLQVLRQAVEVAGLKHGVGLALSDRELTAEAERLAARLLHEAGY